MPISPEFQQVVYIERFSCHRLEGQLHHNSLFDESRVELTELKVGATRYPLRRALSGKFVRFLEELVVDGVSPMVVGEGKSPHEALEDFAAKFHAAFQDLFFKRPFETRSGAQAGLPGGSKQSGQRARRARMLERGNRTFPAPSHSPAGSCADLQQSRQGSPQHAADRRGGRCLSARVGARPRSCGGPQQSSVCPQSRSRSRTGGALRRAPALGRRACFASRQCG